MMEKQMGKWAGWASRGYQQEPKFWNSPPRHQLSPSKRTPPIKGISGDNAACLPLYF